MKLNMKNVVSVLMGILLACICLPGVTFFSRYYLFFMTTMIVLMLVLDRSKHHVLYMDLIYLFFIVSMFAFFCIAYNKAATLSFFLVYLFGFFLVTDSWTSKRMMNIMNVFEIVCIVMLLTQFIEVINNSFIIDNFSFLYGQGNIEVMLHDMRFGIYRGLAGERSEAAYIFVVGLIISLSKIMPLFQDNEKIPRQYILLSVLFICGVMLTGKRMLFAVALLIFVLFCFLGKRNLSTRFKMFLAVLCLVIVLVGTSSFIPQLSVVFERFAETSGNVLNGREDLWDYAYRIVRETFPFGVGYGGYNSYVTEQFNYSWNYHAHNAYLQLFAELGIISFILWIAFIADNLRKSVILIRTNTNSESLNDRSVKWFSFGVQILILVYAISGNTFHYHRQLVLYLIAVAFTNMLRKQRGVSINESRYKYNCTSI